MTDPRARLEEIKARAEVGYLLGSLQEGATVDAFAMSAALTAVLDLHKPERRYLPYEGADVSYDTEREALEAGADVDLNSVVIEDLMENGAPYFDLCAHCKVIEDGPCDGECTLEAGYRESLYPCPTVRAITEHLPKEDDRG